MPIENESRTTRIRYSDGIVQLLLGFYSRKIKLNLSFGPFQCCEVVVALCLTRRKPVEAPSEYKMVLVFSYISSSVCNSVLERLKITIASQCVLAYSCFFNDAVIAKMISVVFLEAWNWRCQNTNSGEITFRCCLVSKGVATIFGARIQGVNFAPLRCVSEI